MYIIYVWSCFLFHFQHHSRNTLPFLVFKGTGLLWVDVLREDSLMTLVENSGSQSMVVRWAAAASLGHLVEMWILGSETLRVEPRNLYLTSPLVGSDECWGLRTALDTVISCVPLFKSFVFSGPFSPAQIDYGFSNVDVHMNYLVSLLQNFHKAIHFS